MRSEVGSTPLLPSIMQTIVSIPGIHCASCAAMIKDISSEFPEIKNVNVDVQTKKVTIEHEESFNLSKWKAEIETLGDAYKVHASPNSA